MLASFTILEGYSKMKTLAASTLALALLLIVSFVSLKVSEARVSSSSQPAQPTPPGNRPKQEVSVPPPTCSPSSTPPSSEEKKYPFDELTLEDAINLGLGTHDWDCDGVTNIKDNCIFVYNPDQKDSNGDEKGDVCDPALVDPSFQDSRCDQDHDGIPDFRDNCLLACNADQKDSNKNGIGDVCDQAFSNAVLTLQVCKKTVKIKVLKPQKISNLKKD